jgi:hypothetical protein
MTLTLNLDPQLEQQLRRQAARLGVNPDDFALEAISERLRQAPSESSHLSARETELLTEVNRGLPPAVWNRYDDLVARRRDETLTEPEHRDLLELGDRIEAAHVRRIELLAELARLRGVQVGALMKQLGIGPRKPVGDNGPAL